MVPDLIHASRDPNEDVRNNATRALGVIAVYASSNLRLGIDVPADPFIGMLHSVEWSDRNKGLFVLMALTQDGAGQEIRKQLREGALDALLEMARWDGAWEMPAFVLGRAAGIPDEEMSWVAPGRLGVGRDEHIEKALHLIAEEPEELH